MSTDRNHATATAAPATMDSDSSAWATRGERWQASSFAASWISPPSSQRHGDDFIPADPTAPFRGDDHA